MRNNDAPTEPHEAVAAEVRTEMQNQHVSQAELGRKLGVSQQWISRRLTGDVPFDVAELARVADVLGVTLDRLTAAAASVAS